MKYFTARQLNAAQSVDQSGERYRRAALSISANILSKAVSILLLILTVRLTVPYLGAERFGVWMTIASFAGMLSFLDMGAANALTNRVTLHSADDTPNNLRRVISGGLASLFILSVAVSVALVLIATNVNWAGLIKLSDEKIVGEVKSTAVIFSVLFGIGLLSNGLQRVYAGLQQAYTAHIVSAFGSGVAVLMLFLASMNKYEIPILLIVTYGCQVISGLILLPLLCVKKLFTLEDAIQYFVIEGKLIFKIGGLFLLLQVGTMIGWGMDGLLISHFLGATHVAVFSVVQRIFQIVTLPTSIINAPLWAAYADAKARNDSRFVRLTLKRSIVITATYSFMMGILLVVGGPFLVKLISAGSVQAELYLLLTYALWAVTDSLGNAFAMYLNGFGIMKPQVVAVSIICILAIPIKIYLIENYGMPSMLMGFFAIYWSVFVMLYGFRYRNEISVGWNVWGTK